ncbi:DNA starvation/stationary phase protection protein Dps [Blastopirellula marina]|uniref:Probable DNA protection during starvation protein n=1 Tax=Blastopirellula marina DSM 3645 TaxID=314230 RepID=A3ZU64_9BACT|nr:DNA starvation/stationary phase protection protein Dps [Blastopirellula marina]EAQ79922.1 probable DNA protection during starvation protein [Blastopirellula marina DSM 3645]
MASIAEQREILPTNTRNEVAQQLQSSLVDQIDLALQAKQAHWNVRGLGFRAVHLHLDEIIESTREASDEIAERIAAIGVAADGRAATVAQSSELEPFPAGIISVQEAIRRISDQMATCSTSLRLRIKTIGDDDLISQDLLIGICRTLEKQLWMLESQAADAAP